MKKTFSFFVFGVGLLFSPTVLGAALQVGLAKVEITPPLGGGTTGYSSAQPTDGVHDPVEARVVVFKSAETMVGLVVWDLCVFNSPWLHEQREGLGLDVLLLANTHTHAGPNLREDTFPSPDAPWRRTVEERTLAAIREAQSNLFAATVLAGVGEMPLGYNRLVRQAGGYAITHFENPHRVPFGPIDAEVGVLRINDHVGNVRCVLVNTACHPVVLGPRNRKISADFPGVMRKRVEAKFGEGVMALFVQGGAGDINPLIMARVADDRSGDFDLVQTVGELLADEVLAVLQRMDERPGQGRTLKSASSSFSVGHRFEAEQSIEVGTASVLINDEIGIVTLPGEPFHKFQRDLRELAEVPFTFFFGYTCNEGYRWPRYLPDLKSAAYGGYGASDATIVEVGTGERLLHRGVAQLYQLQGRLRGEPVRHLNQD